jgi:hypothetical protein
MVEVEHLPGVHDTGLRSGLPRLTPSGLRAEESVARRVDSTSALGDEICARELEAAQRAAVDAAERVVSAALPQLEERRSEMSVSTPVSKTARVGRPRWLVLPAVAAVIAIAVWAVASSVTGSGSQPGRQSVATPATPAPGRASLIREERRYVESLGAVTLAQLNAQQGIPMPAPAPTVLIREQRRFVEGLAAMSLAQLSAATHEALMTSSPLGSMTPAERRQNDALLASLTPTERRYVRGIESMSYAQLAAAFGTGR